MHHRRIRTVAGSLVAFATLVGFAQTAPAPSAASTTPDSGQTPPAATASTKVSDQPIQLSAFEVGANSDKGYTALNSNSITAFKTELGKLPVSADIFDSKFMDDVGATSVEQMINGYSAGSGVSNANPGSSASNSQSLDRNGNSFVSLRGVTAPTMLRDGLMPMNTFFNSGSTGTNFTSSFDTESVEVVNGPQSLLYGVGGAGGVINLVSKRARFGEPAKGSVQFQVDNYGHKLNLLDYAMGTDKVAVRIAVTNQDIGGRRVNVGGPLDGDYAQIAFRIGNTDIRIMGEQTKYAKEGSGSPSLTALSTANDARNGQSIRYLIATNQIQSAANGGASGAGVIGNGVFNWNNVDSFGGWWQSEFTLDTMETIAVESRWTSWLSTQVTAGYRNEVDESGGSTPGIAAPNVAANTTGTWAASSSNPGMLYEPLRAKVFRASAILTNDLFHDRVHSQTVLGGDFSRSDGAVITYQYEQADANGNPTVTASTTNNGYTAFPTVYWSINNGPVREPYFAPLSKHVTVNGQNYVLMIPNDTISSDISASNPLGLSGHGSGDYRIGKAINDGFYAANYSDWLNDRLHTLAGLRYGRTYEINQLEQSSPQPPSGQLEANAHTTSFNAGVNYSLTKWIAPYVQASDSYDAPAVLSADPYGNAPKVAQAIGEEAGIKITEPDGKVSGSISWYKANSKNEQYSFTSTLTNDINPAGLNGRYGAVSNFVSLNRETTGLNATITASPTENWNIRLSAAFVKGTISSNIAYPQYYNDQFYANSAGQVTYQDGTPVYISPTATKAALLDPSAGGVPLTIAMMNASSSAYYANPAAITGAINSSSGAATILKMVSSTHGSILTGATGLPISQIQVAPLATAPPPGQIVLAQPGDYTTQYPRFSYNLTAMYSFRGNLLNGFRMGGTMHQYWKYSDYYYYPNGTGQPNSARVLFYQPPETMFDGIFAYGRKFGRVGLSVQVNINNMFNHYHAYLMPNAVTGWSGPDSATFDAQPRSYTLSTKLSF